jgi:predicted MFS family arabinose efflux permease
MCLAFIINLTAFPLVIGLLPYVAKEIYGTSQTGLGYMIASTGAGALVGSLLVSRYGRTFRPARMMLVGCVLWYLCIAFFGNSPAIGVGMPFLFLAGFASSLSQVPMQAMLLHQTKEQFRGRVMGIRMLAIYGNMLGLLVAGPLIAAVGYRPTATLYCVIGIAFSIFVATYWHSHFWRRDAPANAR